MSDPTQPTDELTVQANAMLRTITAQRDESQARETNLAGQLAIVSLKLEKAQNELKALAPVPVDPEPPAEG